MKCEENPNHSCVFAGLVLFRETRYYFSGTTERDTWLFPS